MFICLLIHTQSSFKSQCSFINKFIHRVDLNHRVLALPEQNYHQHSWLPLDLRCCQYLFQEEKIVIELMTSDRKLKASREGSQSRIYGTWLDLRCCHDLFRAHDYPRIVVHLKRVWGSEPDAKPLFRVGIPCKTGVWGSEPVVHGIATPSGPPRRPSGCSR